MNTRLITSPCVLLSAAVLAFSPVLSAQQPGMDRPRDAGRWQPPAQVDPDTDEVLQHIKAAIEPSDQQWQQIIARYEQLRREQWRVTMTVRESLRPADRARDDRPRRRDRTSTPTGRDEPQDRQAMRQRFVEQVRQQLEPINQAFLDHCRALLRDDQIPSWETCLDTIDLTPPWLSGRFGSAFELLQPGQPAPRFELKDLDGRTVSLEQLLGKPVVIEFGSYTCPVFRSRVDAIRALQKEFGDRVNWVMIYTREAHPSDGWVQRRNQMEGIDIPQHTSFDDRHQCAALTQARLNPGLTILVDELDDRVTEAYGGFPNRGFVLDSTGRLVAKQAWIDPARVREELIHLLGRHDPRHDDASDN